MSKHNNILDRRKVYFYDYFHSPKALNSANRRPLDPRKDIAMASGPLETCRIRLENIVVVHKTRNSEFPQLVVVLFINGTPLDFYSF